MKYFSRRTFLSALAALVLVLVALTAGFYYHRYQNSQKELTKLKSNPQVIAQTESDQLIAAIGKLTPLPTGETPTVATVTDTTKLADQPFFANAKNGDKVLIYTTAKKAFLYRPSTNKIINIAPVNLGSGTGTSAAQTTNTNKKQ